MVGVEKGLSLAALVKGAVVQGGEEKPPEKKGKLLMATNRENRSGQISDRLISLR